MKGESILSIIFSFFKQFGLKKGKNKAQMPIHTNL